MPAGQLRLEGWAKHTQMFPNQQVIKAILGICQYSVRFRYEGFWSGIVIHPNLALAEHDINLVRSKIASELSKSQLETYPDYTSLPSHFMVLALGLIDKSDRGKRRIHHLSYPTGDPTAINSGIPEKYGAITYSGIEDAIRAVQVQGQNSILMKRDFESAFRHIPISRQDTPLLGFCWKENYYAECFVPFGLCTAPYIFNLFAEVFHWVLVNQLKNLNSRAIVIHYLNDFLLVLPPCANPELHSKIFSLLCKEVGLTIKLSKNKDGTVVSFAGIEFDTKRMAIRLPEKKLHKAWTMIEQAAKRKALSLLEITIITEYLNFISTVIPLGRTFLYRLYNMELYFPPRQSASVKTNIRGSEEGYSLVG